jgi:stress response protein YsnF
MLSERELSAAIGSTAYGPDGEKIGTVEHFFTDDRTGAPTWVAVSTGLFGTRRSVVPATEATFTDGRVQLPVTKDAVRTAPQVPGEHLDPDAEVLLRRHYGVGADTGGQGLPPAADAGDTSVQQAPVPARDEARGQPAVGAEDAVTRGDTVPVGSVAPASGIAGSAAPAGGGAMTRSEEQLRVGTERVATTRARLVKYVVTEEVTVTVPIRREEIRVEQVPVDAPDPGPGESLSPAAHVGTPSGAGTPTGAPAAAAGAAGFPEEIVLHAERPVVSVEVVPVERVRLSTDVVRGQEQVTEQLQREQIVVDEDRRPGR